MIRPAGGTKLMLGKIEVIWLPPFCHDVVTTILQHCSLLRIIHRPQFLSSLLVTPFKSPSKACFPLPPDLGVAAQASLRQPNPLHVLYLFHSLCCRLKGEDSTPSLCLPTPLKPCLSPCLPSTDPLAHIYGPSSSELFLRSKATDLKISASRPAKPHCQRSG